jgi:UDP-N-acetylglucosamine 2-epimerase (non-hydrolysing)
MAKEPHIVSVVGARPNFMKIAPIAAELRRRGTPVTHTLVHTGQHYDDAMSKVFFEELDFEEPDVWLGAGSGSHATQTARVMERLEPVLLELRPDVVLVPGDVNSTLATALVAAKQGVPIGHVEAGLRSFDRSMPEEINRIVTDRLSDLLFTHSPEARTHLLAEGAAEESIHDVGNTMIDCLVSMRPRIENGDIAAAHGLEPGNYVVVTLHRPALTDGPSLVDAVDALAELARELPVVFPMHPRTRSRIASLGLTLDGVQVTEPLGYLAFLGLLSGARAALTDSGGIQEETTYLGLPCFTLRDNTERPVTIEMGTNMLLGLDPARIPEIPVLIDEIDSREVSIPPGWDGRAAGRIVGKLVEMLRL